MLLLERTMRINCRPARLGIVNLSKMNKVKGKKERKKEEVDFFLDFILKVYFVLLPNGPQDSASFSVYEQLVESPFFLTIFPIYFFFLSSSAGYYMVDFHFHRLTFFPVGSTCCCCSLLHLKTNKKLYQGRTFIGFEFNMIANFHYKKRYAIMICWSSWWFPIL